jgi:hypothetical protein
MKPSEVPKQLTTEIELGYKNLIVSGCSFTRNFHKVFSNSWPHYLRDLGGFDQVTDLSLPGAGNYHIATSMQWHLENNYFDINDTLVIVMWSGNDRDDEIVSHEHLNDYPFKFNYDSTVVSAITTGIGYTNKGNISRDFCIQKQKYKTYQSRTIENYLYISGLYHYLRSNQYKFLFLNYLDREIPKRSLDFNIDKYLPKNLKSKLNSMVNTKVENIYKWCLKRDLLAEDDFHPSMDGHLNWTREVLLPFLSNCKL